MKYKIGFISSKVIAFIMGIIGMSNYRCIVLTIVRIRIFNAFLIGIIIILGTFIPIIIIIIIIIRDR